MPNKPTIFTALLLSLTMLTACGANADSNSSAPEKAEYIQITQAEAKSIIDSGEEHIILDVRTEEEFSSGHIEGAVLIPDYEIADRAEAELPDKDMLILVYCRSGNRSKRASEVLVSLGYTNVKEFGGINTWEYGIVQ